MSRPSQRLLQRTRQWNRTADGWLHDLPELGEDESLLLPGGDLLIHWRESDGHVLMTGPAELEHEGVFTADLFAGAA